MSTLAIELPLEAIADFCRRNQIVRLEVCGAILSENFSPDDPIEFLVTYAENSHTGLFKYVAQEEELASLLSRSVVYAIRDAIESDTNFLRRDQLLGQTLEVYAI